MHTRWMPPQPSFSHHANRFDGADDFLARSSDELSLTKGDRVELIERDDEFGDGWFLGRHLINGNSGLFPEGSTLEFCDSWLYRG